jgi:hypothetical protein
LRARLDSERELGELNELGAPAPSLAAKLGKLCDETRIRYAFS